MANNIGTLVIAPVRPQSTSDLYPTALSNEILGGLHTVNSEEEMLAIPKERRSVGMFCFVTSLSALYYLKETIENSSWVEYKNISSHFYIVEDLLELPSSAKQGSLGYVISQNVLYTKIEDSWKIHLASVEYAKKISFLTALIFG